jgi:hypothetical protein
VEIFCALLPGLTSGAASMNAAIAGFEGRSQLERLRACSACTGDYEDPDQTAWVEEIAEDEDDANEQGPAGDEFPVQCK